MMMELMRAKKIKNVFFILTALPSVQQAAV